MEYLNILPEARYRVEGRNPASVQCVLNHHTLPTRSSPTLLKSHSNLRGHSGALLTFFPDSVYGTGITFYIKGLIKVS